MKHFYLLLAVLAVSACRKNPTPEPPVDEQVFDYALHHNFEADVTLSGIEGGIKNAPVTLLRNGEAVQTMSTNNQGLVHFVYDKVDGMDYAVTSNFVAVRDTIALDYDGQSVEIRVARNDHITGWNKTGQNTIVTLDGNWVDDRTYQNNTAPTLYGFDTLSNDFLQYISYSMPEGYALGLIKPELLDRKNTIYMKDSGDVFMTYVDEGAGFRNTMGYFYYDTTNVPTSESDVDTIWTAFNNFSGVGKQGDLEPGDKIWLGYYPAGTTIEFVLQPNGFNGVRQPLKTYFDRIYSESTWNPESDTSLQKHSVVFYDTATARFVIGFEDVNRSLSSCDQDMNDAIFYITSNPIDAIDTTGFNAILTEADDTDLDGTPDADDAYPNDARYASVYTTNGNLHFEDLYPSKGDYDMNDIVLIYELRDLQHTNGETRRQEWKFYLNASGCSIDNGFAFSFADLDYSMVSNAQFNWGNGKGYLQDVDGRAEFVLADVMTEDWGKFRNVGNSYTAPEEFLVYYDVNGAVSSDAFYGDAMDAFIFNFVDSLFAGSRNEMHLIGFEPSSLVDTALYQTRDDIRFDSATSRPTYMDWENRRPWGLHLAGYTLHPLEKIDIRDAYSDFDIWVGSDGSLKQDWYDRPDSTKVFIE